MGGCLGKEPKTEEELLRKHYSVYAKHLLPLEEKCLFNRLVDPPYSEADVLAKPIILIAGQYSTGKTTFIKALLNGYEYPGMRIAVEMATDNFTAILRENRDYPGSSMINSTEHPFHALRSAFGNNFLQRFRSACVTDNEQKTDILDDITIIDTPGTLDGAADERNYNFAEAMGWFARRASLIIIFFDVNKMGVSTEMKNVLDNIQGNEEKIRFVFNKADTISEKDLAGSFAGLRHNLAKSMPTPEVPEVYVTSLTSLKHEYNTDNPEYIEWFTKDKNKLLEDIKRLRSNKCARKNLILDKRARMVKNHAYVIRELRVEKEKLLGLFKRQLKPADKDDLVEKVPGIYTKVQKQLQSSPEEFISVTSLQGKLKDFDLHTLPKINPKNIEVPFEKIQEELRKLASVKLDTPLY